ncbi:MAG: T9SS type A sorting domain-containing protein [Vicingaceae bacterium]|nr:T9SS type A sorting domain-containing protein [Vicingaceae bacterium]
MKKIYSSLFLFTMGIVMYAQPVLTSANFAPVVGDNQLYHVGDTNSVLDNTIGANVLFDYSGLQGLGISQTSYFVNPSTTTYASDFPFATYADTTDGAPVNKRYAQLVGADSLVNSGLVLNINSFGVTIVKFNFDPEITMKFPFNFGDSFTDNYAGQFTSVSTSVTTNGNGTVDVIADAWGTLRMPNIADITGVLRVVQIDTLTTDTVFLPPPFPPILPLTLSGKVVSYYKPSISKFPLLSFIDGNNAGQTTRTVISQYPLPPVSVNELENNYAFELFPNPTNTSLTTLRFDATKASQGVEITILNQLGQQVKSVFNGAVSNGKNSIQIETSALPKGIYFVKVKIENQSFTKKLIVQ